ncbi:MAG: hypothetical protein ACRCYR_20815 [Phycicoccus sp.]
MTRILRVEARRSTALAIIVGCAVIGVLVAYPLGERRLWENGMEMAAFPRGFTFILMAALAAGAGSWHAGRDRGAVTDLIAAAARPRPQRLAPSLVVLGVAAVVAYLLVLAVAAVTVAPAATYLNVTVIAAVTAVGALTVLTAARLGFAAGQLIRSRLTTPVVVVTVAVLFAGPELLSDPLGTESGSVLLVPTLNRPFGSALSLSQTASALQALWLLALAAAAALAVRATRRSVRLLAILPVAVAAAVVVPQLPDGSDATPLDDVIDLPAGYVVALPADHVVALPAGYVVDRAAAAPVCAQGTPQVCVTRANAAVLPQATEAAREALTRLTCLPEPPTAATQLALDDGGYRGRVSGGTLWMIFRDVEPDGTLPSADVEVFATDLVEQAVEESGGTGSSCPRPAASATGSRG